MAKPKEKEREREGPNEQTDGPPERSDYEIAEAGNEGRALAERILEEWRREITNSKKRKRA